MTPLGDLELYTEDGVLVARLLGEIDLSNARHLGDRLTAAVPNDALGVVIDLSDTTYLDSSGVHLIFELAERLHGRQQRLAIAAPEGAPVRRVLSVVEVENAAPVIAGVESAAAGIRGEMS